jgi:DNA polymerase III gamma/tau subunit
MRDLMIVRIDPTRLADPEIAAEDERDRLKVLVEQYSREDLMRAFDLLSRAEYEIRNSSQPRHHFEMALIKWIHLRQLTPLTDLIAAMEGGAAGGAAPLAPRPRSSAPAASPRPVARPTPAATRPSSPSEPRPATPRPTPAASPAASSAPAARSTAPVPAPVESPKAAGDLKTALLTSIREQSRTFYGMVVAQAQKIEIEGNAVVFTFAPVHKTLRTQLGHKRAWVEQLAQALAGRKMTVVDREAAPAPAAEADAAAAEAHQADLRARVQAEPAVQAVLDVFGGQIEDVEEID